MIYIKKKIATHSTKPKEIISGILYYFTLYRNKTKISVQLTHISIVIQQLTLRCFWCVRKMTTEVLQINHLTSWTSRKELSHSVKVSSSNQNYALPRTDGPYFSLLPPRFSPILHSSHSAQKHRKNSPRIQSGDYSGYTNHFWGHLKMEAGILPTLLR